MKKQILTTSLAVILMFGVVFSGCSRETPPTTQTAYKGVTQVGQIPDDFKTIISNDLFSGATAFEHRLLKSKIVEMNEDGRPLAYQVEMLDLYGHTLASHTCSTDTAYHARTLTATADGGFLFVLGFSDYASSQDTWASDKGFASRIIKCDANGTVQFDISLDSVEGSGLAFCFEKNDQFYFFGDIETPETKKRGIHSPTDIYMLLVDKNGAVLNEQYIAGSDYDSLTNAEVSAEGFVLTVSAQSGDGDFEGSDSNGYPRDWVFTVNDQLEVTDRNQASGRDFFDRPLGMKDGQAVYQSNALFDGFDAGTPEIFLDYSDFYLIVSRNITGEYENTPPAISSIWYYTESVYSAYDNNGKLLFRASVDSSPDYDAYVQDLSD